MWINVIDYRGEGSLLAKRTEVFLRQQQDFKLWQQHGHKFRCFTQHTDNNYPGFDDVIVIPRGSAAQSRNHVLDYYPKDTWTGIWDNDATLYWNKSMSQLVPEQWDQIIALAEQHDLKAFVPFDPRQTPYENIPDHWTFRSTNILKGTMVFLKTMDLRYRTDMPALEDIEYAFQLTKLGLKSGRLEQMSMKEMANNASTIFDENRKQIYSQSKQKLLELYGDLFLESRLGVNGKFIIKRMGELQRSYWNNTTLKSLAKKKHT